MSCDCWHWHAVSSAQALREATEWNHRPERTKAGTSIEKVSGHKSVAWSQLHSLASHFSQINLVLNRNTQQPFVLSNATLCEASCSSDFFHF